MNEAPLGKDHCDGLFNEAHTGLPFYLILHLSHNKHLPFCALEQGTDLYQSHDL